MYQTLNILFSNEIGLPLFFPQVKYAMVPQHGPFSLHTILEGPSLHQMAFPMIRPLDDSQGPSPFRGHGPWLVWALLPLEKSMGPTSKSILAPNNRLCDDGRRIQWRISGRDSKLEILVSEKFEQISFWNLWKLPKSTNLVLTLLLLQLGTTRFFRV